jgi:hypothetical protein
MEPSSGGKRLHSINEVQGIRRPCAGDVCFMLEGSRPDRHRGIPDLRRLFPGMSGQEKTQQRLKKS